MSDAPTNTRREELARRFGMTPDAVDQLLTETHGEYAAGPEVSTGARAEVATPVAKPATPSASGGLTAAILVALFVVLGITMSFKKGCFEQRNHVSPPIAQKALVDTVQAMMNKQAQAASTPPMTPSDVGPNEVPPEALVAPKETPNASNSGITSMDQAEQAVHGAATSSNFEAQERLAEMRSEGKKSAHIVRHKGRVPSYEVRER